MSIEITLEKQIKLIAFYIISLFFVFIISRNYYLTKEISNNEVQIKLEEELNIAKSKMNDIEKRNEELIKLNDELDILNKELQIENDGMKEDLDNIKYITDSVKIKLNALDTSSDNSITVIKNLKENQNIFRDYFSSIALITK